MACKMPSEEASCVAVKALGRLKGFFFNLDSRRPNGQMVLASERFDDSLAQWAASEQQLLE